ncbi:MAG: hypothetical protein CTY25_03550 [Methylobacterium sp.]|nr:MAG: hypothetical protein CTY25_03550 [Methylobacterium sp.]
MTTASLAAPMSRAATTSLSLLTLSQVVLFLVPLIVLGQAIGWPASLRLPAAEALPLIARNALAVQIGYWGYMLTAIAMVPFVIALRRFARARGAQGLLVDTMAALGIAAAVLKTLGIVRWLLAMPTLATLHANSTDPVMRSMIELTYTATNAYAGSVGELLGVQLFSGLWLMLLGLVFARIGWRLNGLASLLIGVGFFLNALRTIVPELNLLGAVLPPLALLWLVILAITFWRRG